MVGKALSFDTWKWYPTNITYQPWADDQGQQVYTCGADGMPTSVRWAPNAVAASSLPECYKEVNKTGETDRCVRWHVDEHAGLTELGMACSFIDCLLTSLQCAPMFPS